MSLRNLAAIGQLVEHETDKEQVGKLMDAATRCVNDAREESISMETRLDNDHMLLLDTFRVKRNAIDYTGELVDEGSVTNCIEAAVHLQEKLQSWLAKNRPDLLG